MPGGATSVLRGTPIEWKVRGLLSLVHTIGFLVHVQPLASCSLPGKCRARMASIERPAILLGEILIQMNDLGGGACSRNDCMHGNARQRVNLPSCQTKRKGSNKRDKGHAVISGSEPEEEEERFTHPWQPNKADRME